MKIKELKSEPKKEIIKEKISIKREGSRGDYTYTSNGELVTERDIKVGHTWDSPEGKVTILREDEKYWYFQSENQSRSGITSMQEKGTNEILNEIYFGEADIKYYIEKEKSDKARAEREAKEQAEFEDVKGFLDDYTPLQRGRKLKTLNEIRRFNNKPLKLKTHIENEVARGSKVETVTYKNYNVDPPKEVTERRVIDENDTFWSEKVLTKTGMDYANYLINNKITK